MISDEVKPDAYTAIEALRAQNVKKTVMLTGDARTVGEKTAEELGIDQVFAQLLPTDKVEHVEALMREKK